MCTIRKEDATPSWSGYIFQGEVALCMALENIINLDNNIPNDDYCLRLEENEDFSLSTDSLEVFQVKAYLSNDSTKFSKYKDVIEELISKYYYSVTVTSDPIDGRKTIKTYSNIPRDIPIKSVLITALSIDDVDERLSTLDEKYSSINLNYFKIIHGVYRLDNISSKIDYAINTLYPDLQDGDIEIKRCYCCSEISKKINDRHRTKIKEPISFNTIKNWLENSPNVFTEEICWYEISKIFFQSLYEDLKFYDLANEGERDIYLKIQQSLRELSNLESNKLINLLNSHLVPHKILDKKDLRASYGDYINKEVVKQVVLKALKRIDTNPIFEKMQYMKKVGKDVLCYQLLIHNNQFGDDPIDNRRFQEHCENIYNQPLTKEIDYFVTSNLDREKEDVKNRLYEILGTDTEFDEHNKSNYEEDLGSRVFGFRKIDNAIQDINNNNERTN